MPAGELRVELTDRQAYMMASMVTYFLAIFVGTFKADDAILESGNLRVTVYTAIWAVLAAVTMVTFIMAFRLSWRSGFHFMGIYMLQLFGVSVYLAAEDPGTTESMVPVFMVFLSYAVALSFIWRTKDLRDGLMADRRIVVEYLPLGIWTLEVLASVTFLLASLIAFLQWAEEGGELYYFLLYQVIFYGLLVHAFILPEKLEYVVEKQLPEQLKARRELVAPREHKRALASVKTELPPDICPLCGGGLMTEKRSCPECGNGFGFAWCPTSEEYIITCPYCSLTTPYGRERCVHCERELQTAIKCPTCAIESPLSAWSG